MNKKEVKQCLDILSKLINDNMIKNLGSWEYSQLLQAQGILKVLYQHLEKSENIKDKGYGMGYSYKSRGCVG